MADPKDHGQPSATGGEGQRAAPDVRSRSEGDQTGPDRRPADSVELPGNEGRPETFELAGPVHSAAPPLTTLGSLAGGWPEERSER